MIEGAEDDTGTLGMDGTEDADAETETEPNGDAADNDDAAAGSDTVDDEGLGLDTHFAEANPNSARDRTRVTLIVGEKLRVCH